jgi:hypothetical protein
MRGIALTGGRFNRPASICGVENSDILALLLNAAENSKTLASPLD